MIFNPVPRKNPLNAPKAALSALFASLESWIISPIKAPANGAIKIKIGPKKNETIRPIVQPKVAALLPPAFLVITEGKMLSITVTKTAAIPVAIKIQISICE